MISYDLIGVPSGQMLSALTGALYTTFIEKDVKNFDDFHRAILDMFK